MQLKNVQLELAKLADAETIAILSRDIIEIGLPWRWRPIRVAKLIHDPEAVVLAARANARIIGFSIMHFAAEDAHLLLFAVVPEYRHQGVGTALCSWLEKSARIAGIFRLHLEVRSDNLGARAFYRRLSFTEIRTLSRYYDGREAAIRLEKHLAVA